MFSHIIIATLFVHFNIMSKVILAEGLIIYKNFVAQFRYMTDLPIKGFQKFNLKYLILESLIYPKTLSDK